jgi:hypothetical protein
VWGYCTAQPCVDGRSGSCSWLVCQRFGSAAACAACLGFPGRSCEEFVVSAPWLSFSLLVWSFSRFSPEHCLRGGNPATLGLCNAHIEVHQQQVFELLPNARLFCANATPMPSHALQIASVNGLDTCVTQMAGHGQHYLKPSVGLPQPHFIHA